MYFSFSPGTDGEGKLGNGNAQCWCAIGQEYTTPGECQLQFTADPSVYWSCNWGGTFWRNAAGMIWIGQVINMWDPEGNFLGTPVSTKIRLYSYSDTNWSGNSNQSGQTSGYWLSSWTICPASVIVECWVVIGGTANADGNIADGGMSFGENYMETTVSSLSLRMWF
jgi:hypothetical protein